MSGLVLSVLLEVQAEFATWSIPYAEAMLCTPSFPAVLLEPDPQLIRVPDPSRFICTSDPEEREQSAQRCLSHSDPVYIVRRSYSPDGTSGVEKRTELPVVKFTLMLESHPTYDSCAPLARSVFKGDDDDRMPFLPYADDPTFDHVDHSRWYGALGWQDFNPIKSNANSLPGSDLCSDSYWKTAVDVGPDHPDRTSSPQVNTM